MSKDFQDIPNNFMVCNVFNNYIEVKNHINKFMIECIMQFNFNMEINQINSFK